MALENVVFLRPDSHNNENTGATAYPYSDTGIFARYALQVAAALARAAIFRATVIERQSREMSGVSQ